MTPPPKSAHHGAPPGQASSASSFSGSLIRSITRLWVAAGLSLGVCMIPAPALADAGNKALSVNAGTTSQRDWPVEIPCSGSVAAWQDAVIAAETNGLRIAELRVEIGARVKRGQLLARLAQDAVIAETRRAEASLAAARAALEHARANANRARSLQDSGALSNQQINDYLTAEATASANLAVAEALLQVQRVQLRQTEIRAVDDGIITSRSAVLGQVVSTGTELFRLQRQGKVEWLAELEVRQLAMVHVGDSASVTLPNGQTLQGQVRLIAPVVAPGTHRGLVHVSLPNSSDAGTNAGMHGSPPALATPSATPGSYLSGRIRQGNHKVATLPATAVVYRDGHAYVFELLKDSHVARRKVDLGDTRNGEVEIRSGLAPNAHVVLAGGAFLADGDSVQIVKEPT